MFYGDKKDRLKMMKEARNSKPISLSDDILPRVIHHMFQTVKKYDTEYMLSGADLRLGVGGQRNPLASTKILYIYFIYIC